MKILIKIEIDTEQEHYFATATNSKEVAENVREVMGSPNSVFYDKEITNIVVEY